MAGQRQDIWRNAYNTVMQATSLNQSVTTKAHKDKTYHKGWITDQWGKVKNVLGQQIGGQSPGSGPDVLKHIKQYDSQNSSGAVKDALDIMMKFQQSIETGDLLKNIQPIQSILGGGLYGKFASAAASAASSQKVQNTNQTTTTVPPKEDIIAELIAAAMAMLTPDDAVTAAAQLTSAEINAIRAAYYRNTIYASTVMIQTFVDAINYLMPIFRATKGTGQGAAVS